MLDRRTHKAAILAAAVPPVGAAIFLASFVVGGAIADGRLPSSSEISFIPFMAIAVGFIISFPLCFFIGLPIHLLLQRFGLSSVFWYVAIASLLTFSAAIFGTGYPDTENTEKFFVFIATIIAFSGPVAAVTFWLIARPDRYPVVK